MLQQQQQQLQQVKQQQRWRCDICRVLTFHSFQEACDHEAQCTSSVSNSDTQPNPTDAIISLSSCSSSSSTTSMSPTAASEAQERSVATSTRIRKTPDTKNIQVTHTTTNKKSRQQRQSTITAIHHKQIKPNHNEAKEILSKKVTNVTPDDVEVQVVEALPKTTRPKRIRTTGSSTGKSAIHNDSVDVLSSSSAVCVQIPSTTNKSKKAKKLKSTSSTTSNYSGKIGAVQSKKRSTKTPDHRSKNTATHVATLSSSHVTTMMHWFAIPNIPEDTNEDIIINVDDDEDDTKTQQEKHTQFMTEQVVAYQFREERRKKQQAEREKQWRRQQLRITEEQSDISKASTKIGRNVVNITNDGAATTKTTMIRPNVLATNTVVPGNAAIQAIRFPILSHILPCTTNIQDSEPLGRTDPSLQKQWWWNPSASNTNDKSIIVRSILRTNHNMTTTTICGGGGGGDVESSRGPGVFDLLQTAIYSSIVPIPTPSMDSRHNGRESTLWVDRYYSGTGNNDQITGTSTTESYDQLRTFIERFMLERQKVERANVQKQIKQRQTFFGLPIPKRNNNAKTKRRYAADDDDDHLWDDDDYTNSNSAFDADRWSSLCVISGPIGCGKSNIVHRVAKQLGCRKVVELHTGMKRNAASMKRIVEEATKSHSTFDMMQNQSKGVTKEDEEESSLDDRGSAVTVIVIDEVDNLDSETDCGFWSALCDLYKESKCPIIVTCNSIPKELNATSFRWTHIPMDRPTAAQCAVQLRDILWQEGYTVRHTSNSAVDPMDAFVTIAKLGNCDIRRILQELQLFHAHTASVPSSRSNDLDWKVPVVNASNEVFQPFPTIESVHPNVLYFDRYTSITVKGTNFLSMVDPSPSNNRHDCKVYIGNYCCPQARIMNDQTILAVVTPSEHTATKYLPVNVSCKRSVGICSSTRNSITKMDLPDQTKVLSSGNVYFIECRFGEATHQAESDSENEFDSDVSREVASEKLLETASAFEKLTNESADSDVATQMLNESVDLPVRMVNYGAVDVQETVATTLPKFTEEDSELIDKFDVMAGLASDASLFEDVGLNPLPILSGACRGYGFVYTEDFPKRTNEHSKPYVPIQFLYFFHPCRYHVNLPILIICL